MSTFGTAKTAKVTERLKRFAFVPHSVVDRLVSDALSENWGTDDFVLYKYLAVHIPWAIEQERFSHSDNQLYLAAGSLQTHYGTPLYLIFEPNNKPDQQPWAMTFAGSNVSAPELPRGAAIPEPPPIPAGVEIVMMHDHIIKERLRERLGFLADTPRVAQMCAVSGAIQWSLNRSLQMPYWYYGRMNYIVPLYLQSRENITQAPDAVAPIEVNDDCLVVRTILPPHAPYANARVAVHRHDQLPAWMLDCWNHEAAGMTESEVEDPEAV